MSPPVLILAGGRGSRMGGADKALLPLRGRPLLAQLLQRLGPAAAAISANGDPARFATFGLPVLADPLPDFPGPLAGILAGMRHFAALGAAHMATAAVDTPFVPADLPRRLLDEAVRSGAAVVLARAGGRLQPTFGLWRTDLAEALARALAEGGRRIDAVAAALGATVLDVPDEAAFFNVNTPEDLARAEAMDCEQRSAAF